VPVKIDDDKIVIDRWYEDSVRISISESEEKALEKFYQKLVSARECDAIR
jgi:hypothetical protein